MVAERRTVIDEGYNSRISKDQKGKVRQEEKNALAIPVSVDLLQLDETVKWGQVRRCFQMETDRKRANNAKCVEKKDPPLPLITTLRPIIWRVFPFLAASVRKYSGQDVTCIVMFQDFINN